LSVILWHAARNKTTNIPENVIFNIATLYIDKIFKMKRTKIFNLSFSSKFATKHENSTNCNNRFYIQFSNQQ